MKESQKGYDLQVKHMIKSAVFLLLLVSYCLLPHKADAQDGVSARAALVMDAKTGRVLFAKNPDLRLPPASTTKLMTAMVVLDRLKLSDVVTISKTAEGVCPTKANLKAGEVVTVGSLLYASLMRSANDAAVALAEAVSGSEAEFVRLMNKKAEALGLTDTRFINSNGLPGPGQYTTVHDLAVIMSHALNHPAIKGILRTKIAEIYTKEGRTVVFENTNKLLWSEHEFFGGKTGYTVKAGHCIVCAAERDDMEVITALLGSPSREALWLESERLTAKGFQMIVGNKEPVVYLTKADERPSLRNASYSKIKVKRLTKKALLKKKSGMKTKKNAKGPVKKRRLTKQARGFKKGASKG